MRRVALLLALPVAAAAWVWLGYGPHRRATDRLLEGAQRRGLLWEGGTREVGLFSSRLRDVRLSPRDAPGITVDIGRIEIRHWPLLDPRVSIEQARVNLRGDPVVLFEAVAKMWHSPGAKLVYRPLQVSYHHRLLGQLRLSGVTFARQGEAFEIKATRAELGDLGWQDVTWSLRQRKSMLAIGFGTEPGQGRVQLACFPPTDGVARFILDLSHQSARTLLRRLGGDVGDAFDATQVAGSISMDVPEDSGQPVRGRVQLVFDRWPTFTPVQAEPLLGRTFALLSSVAATADGAHWLLPHVELTMPVFSLGGKGSIRLGRQTRFELEVEGERTCRELRALLPPSQELDSVRQFLDGPKGNSATRARLLFRWSTASKLGLRPEWRFEPGCGLGPWPRGGI